MADDRDGTTDESNIEQINNNILNDDINKDYDVQEEENTFRRTADGGDGKDASEGKNADDTKASSDDSKGKGIAKSAKTESLSEGTEAKNDRLKKVKKKAAELHARVETTKPVAMKHNVKNNVKKKNNDNVKNVKYDGREQTKKINGTKFANAKKDWETKIKEKKDSRVENMKNKTQHKAHKKNKAWKWILLGLILIALIVALIFALKSINPAKSDKGVAATVNGEPIMQSDIDMKYNGLNPILQSVYTKEAILNQTIDELLLLQEAKRTGITVPKAEIDSELNNFKMTNGLTDDQLKEILAKQNMTLDVLKGLIEKKILIRDLLNKTILKNISVTDAEISAYYNANKESFLMPEEVKAAHILVGFDNRTEAEAEKLIKEIMSKVTADNFCSLAEKYSEDPGSKNKCGEYTFAKGQMVKEFEDKSFELKKGAMDIVKTVYGYHLIKKIDSYPSVQTPLSEVSADINQTLSDQKAQDNFDTFLKSLREKADIKIHMETSGGKDAKALEKTNIPTGAVVSEQKTETPTEQKTAEKKTEAVTNTNDQKNTESGNLESFAKCLTDKGAKMYGAYWCPHCEKNKKVFGDALKYVTYIECAVEGQPQVQTKLCTDAGIGGYPTWIINGQKYPGEQSLEKLAQLSGCKI